MGVFATWDMSIKELETGTVLRKFIDDVEDMADMVEYIKDFGTEYLCGFSYKAMEESINGLVTCSKTRIFWSTESYDAYEKVLDAVQALAEKYPSVFIRIMYHNGDEGINGQILFHGKQREELLGTVEYPVSRHVLKGANWDDITEIIER